MQTLPESGIISLIKAGAHFEAEVEGGGFIISIDDYIPCICTAIHNGHTMREELLNKCALSDKERLYEEDPYTGDFISFMPITLIVKDSRYEYDLNRSPENCIYDTAWDKQVWTEALTEEERATSLEKHAIFYRVLLALGRYLNKRFGGYVVYDIHSYNQDRVEGNAPTFNIGTEQINLRTFEGVVNHFHTALEKIVLPDIPVDVAQNKVFFGRGYLATYLKKRFRQVLVLPIEVKKIYIDSSRYDPFPLVISALKEGFRQAIFDNVALFSRRVSIKKSFRRRDLMPSIFEPIALDVDEKLYTLGKKIDTLYYINPLNLAQEKKRFFSRKFKYNPVFKYRQLKIDPYLFKEKLYRLPVEKIKDISLQNLYQRVIDNFATKIDLLTTRGTSKFLYNSLRYHGEPNQSDINNARFILYAPDLETQDEEMIDTRGICEAFEAAFIDYDIDCKLELSSRIIAGATVNNARRTILINKDIVLNRTELNALVNHELGIHMVTTANAVLQPLYVFKLGLPGNTQTQEGLAIMSEYLSGNITTKRLKVLGLRVLAVDMMIRGYDFSHTFQRLMEEHAVDPDMVYPVVARVFRGGGFTKDFLYLRGLRDALHYFNMNKNLRPMFIGKTSFEFFDVIEEFISRKLILPPKYVPKSFQNPSVDNPILNYLIKGIR